MSTNPFSGITPTRLLWVSTTGSPTSGDGSHANPFATLKAAVNHAKPGTAIMVEAGTYVGNTVIRPDHSGTPTAPVWIISADGPQAAHLTATKSDPVIQGTGVSNIVVDGFEITGGRTGIAFSQGGFDFTKLIDNIVIEHNLVEGARLDGIKANGGDHVYVLDNTVNGGAGDEGVDFLAINDGVISGNEVTHITGLVAMYVKGGSTGDVIMDNYIHDVSNDGIGVGNHVPDTSFFRPGFSGCEAKDVLVSGNVVVGVGGRALVAVGAVDSTIRDNFLGGSDRHYTIVVNNDVTDAHGVPTTLYSKDLTVADNILASTPDPLQVKPSNETGFVFHHNPFGSLLVGSTAGDHLTGDQGVNFLDGLAGDDVLSGLGGDDALHGGPGDDTLDGGAGDDTLDGGGGRDTASYATAGAAVTVTLAVAGAQNTHGDGVDTLIGISNLIGSPFNDTLTGDAAGTALTGGAGNDKLTGGAGADTLTGGPGADRFILKSLSDSTVAPSGQDVITDFSHAQHDKIVLTAIDANALTAGNQAFTLVPAFTHAPGQLIEVAKSGGWLVEGDVNGDGSPDFAIMVHAAAVLVPGDFAL